MNANCPACGHPLDGKILVCFTCWQRAGAKDRAKFYQLFHRNPTKPEAWRTKAEQIVRELRAERVERNEPVPLQPSEGFAPPRRIVAMADALARAPLVPRIFGPNP